MPAKPEQFVGTWRLLSWTITDGDGKVTDESLPSRRIDARTLAWSVPVPANGETILTFTVDNGW